MNTEEMHKNVEKLDELDTLLAMAREELQVFLSLSRSCIYKGDLVLPKE